MTFGGPKRTDLVELQFEAKYTFTLCVAKKKPHQEATLALFCVGEPKLC